MRKGNLLSRSIGKIIRTLVLFGFTCGSANALTFTALVSGNFSNSVTWGGLLPSSLVTVDSVIVPSGLTVTLDQNQTFSSTATLIVNGTLSSGSNNTFLAMISGILGGSGTITVDSLAMGLTSGFNFTGTITANNFASLGANQSSAASTTVNNYLYINNGNLYISSGSLNLSNNANIMMNGGTLSVGAAGLLVFPNSYSVNYSSTSSAVAGAELNVTGLNNFTVNIGSGNSLTLSADLNINGMLTLTSGTLVLNSHNLTFAGSSDFASTGSGGITSTSGSNISVVSANSISGGLRFTSGGNTVNNLSIGMASANNSVSLGSSLNVNGNLNLNTGKINLQGNNLVLGTSAHANGGSSSSYVITGSGMLQIHLGAGISDTFQVGTSLNYAPAIVTANSTSATSNIGVMVNDSVYALGTGGTNLSVTHSGVNATWFVSSDVSSGLNLNLELMWSSNMEMNGFNRTNAYISHYTSGSWDASTLGSASTSGSMYAMSRNNITSLSPFTLADNNSDLNNLEVQTLSAYREPIVVYPNPTTGTLYFTGTNAGTFNVDVYDLSGRLLKRDIANKYNSISVRDMPIGLYSIYFYGDGVNASTKFVKQ